MQGMKARHLSCVCIVVLALGLFSGVSAQDPVKGAALVAAARQAIGGESRLVGVKTLQVTGTFRRVIDGNDTEGDFEVFLELPDKYLRSEKTGTPGEPSTETIEALVGTEVRDVVRGGGGGGRRRGANSSGDDSGDDAAADGPPAADGVDNGTAAGDDAGQRAAANAAGPGRGRGGVASNQETQPRARQTDVARLMMMWLLRIDVPMPWIGIAESPDGKADVLEGRLADGQPTRLFLDIASHMPLMLQWQGSPTRAGGQGGRRAGRGQPGGNQGGEPAAAEAAGQRESGPSQPIRFDMTFSDHRAVNGIKFPYIITRGINGKTIERWTIRNYRVNPSFTPETFAR